MAKRPVLLICVLDALVVQALICIPLLDGQLQLDNQLILLQNEMV